jgi:putative transposase
MGSNLAIKPGSEVDYGERRFVIMQVISFEAVVARDVETGELERLAIADLRPVSSQEPSVLPPDLAGLDDRDWAEARRRLDLIEPVLEKARLPRSVMAERARAGGVEVTTLYRWARAFRATGLLSSLLPYKPAGGRGKSRLEPTVEQIVLQTIEEHFLTPQQRSIQSTAGEVARRCREGQLSAPHAGTIRARIVALPLRERLSRRSHRKAALDRFAARPGVRISVPKQVPSASLSGSIQAIFAHPLEKFRACLPTEALEASGGEAKVSSNARQRHVHDGVVQRDEELRHRNDGKRGARPPIRNP